ncbi:MAG: glycosyltransferase family 4 protein [Flavobacteriales bacterium]|nr:glycosyltransferase family 4 protein [Flavobacteriales bacterium]
MKRRIIIDLVPIRPGKGGTGSGIWTHAKELVLAMDKDPRSEAFSIHCLINPAQEPHFSTLRHIHAHRYPDLKGSGVLRLLWIHLFLPMVCLLKRAKVLHKVATETPLYCPAVRVTTVHDFFNEFIHESTKATPSAGSRYFAWASRLCFKKSQHVITVSEAVKQEAIARFPGTRATITAVHNGADVLRADVPAGHPPGSPFTVMCVAKFMPYKGQMEALGAFEQLLDQLGEGPDPRLVLHGFSNDIGYFNAIQDRLTRSPLRGKVELRGYGASRSIMDIYADADLFLFLTRYEGFGLPVVESQGLNIPVVCSDIPVLREVGGEGAIYVDRSDPRGVAAAIQTLMTDRAAYERLQRAGRHNVDRFSWSRCALETLEVYDQASS